MLRLNGSVFSFLVGFSGNRSEASRTKRAGASYFMKGSISCVLGGQTHLVSGVHLETRMMFHLAHLLRFVHLHLRQWARRYLYQSNLELAYVLAV